MAILHHESPYGTSFWEVTCFKCNSPFLLENFGSDPDTIEHSYSIVKRQCSNCAFGYTVGSTQKEKAREATWTKKE